MVIASYIIVQVFAIAADYKNLNFKNFIKLTDIK